MAKTNTLISKATDALAALQKFVLGASEAAPSAAAIRSRMDGLDVASLERAVTELEDQRRRVLVAGSDSELAELDARIAAANRAADRGVALRDELERILAEAEVREAAADQARRRVEAERLSEAAIDAIRKKLPQAFDQVRTVLRQVAEAEAACAAVNAGLPSDQQVDGPEAWRNSTSRRPETIIGEKIVSLWCFERSGDPLNEAQQARVYDSGGGRGMLSSGDRMGPGIPIQMAPVVKRSFRRVTKIPAVSGGTLASLARSVALPPLQAGEQAHWDGERLQAWSDPETVLAALDATEASLNEGPPELTPIVVLEPIADLAQAA